jgi:hypothetical protein
MTSGMLHRVVWEKQTDVSKALTALILVLVSGVILRTQCLRRKYVITIINRENYAVIASVTSDMLRQVYTETYFLVSPGRLLYNTIC